MYKNCLWMVALFVLILDCGCEEAQKMNEGSAKEYADRHKVCIDSIKKYGYLDLIGYQFDTHKGVCLCNNIPCDKGCSISGKCNICDTDSCNGDKLVHCVEGEQFEEKCNYGCFLDDSDQSVKCRECPPGDVVCTGESSYQSCDNGKWSDIKLCKAQEICNPRKQGSNKCDTNCEEGAQVCVDGEDNTGVVKKCENRRYVKDDAFVCTGSCQPDSNGVKCDVCINGRNQCKDGNYQECRKGGWKTVESCGAKGCDSSSNKCKICVPGTKKCNLDKSTILICNNDGSEYEEDEHCDSGCVNDVCAASELKSCDDNEINIYYCLSNSSDISNFVTACLGKKTVFVNAGSCDDLNKMLQDSTNLVVNGNEFQGCYTFKDDSAKSFEINNDGKIQRCSNGCKGSVCDYDTPIGTCSGSYSCNNYTLYCDDAPVATDMSTAENSDLNKYCTQYTGEKKQYICLTPSDGTETTDQLSKLCKCSKRGDHYCFNKKSYICNNIDKLEYDSVCDNNCAGSNDGDSVACVDSGGYYSLYCENNFSLSYKKVLDDQNRESVTSDFKLRDSDKQHLDKCIAKNDGKNGYYCAPQLSDVSLETRGCCKSKQNYCFDTHWYQCSTDGKFDPKSECDSFCGTDNGVVSSDLCNIDISCTNTQDQCSENDAYRCSANTIEKCMDKCWSGELGDDSKNVILIGYKFDAEDIIFTHCNPLDSIKYCYFFADSCESCSNNDYSGNNKISDDNTNVIDSWFLNPYSSKCMKFFGCSGDFLDLQESTLVYIYKDGSNTINSKFSVSQQEDCFVINKQ